jgi:hypothetical protein
VVVAAAAIILQGCLEALEVEALGQMAEELELLVKEILVVQAVLELHTEVVEAAEKEVQAVMEQVVVLVVLYFLELTLLVAMVVELVELLERLILLMEVVVGLEMVL